MSCGLARLRRTRRLRANSYTRNDERISFAGFGFLVRRERPLGGAECRSLRKECKKKTEGIQLADQTTAAGCILKRTRNSKMEIPDQDLLRLVWNRHFLYR